MQLTERDTSILSTLTAKVRLLTLSQIAAAWWPPSRSADLFAKRRIRQLQAHGYIDERTLPALPMLGLDTPILCWAAGDPDPDFDAVAHRLETRWVGTYRPTRIYFASPRAASEFGVLEPRRILHPDQVTHDLHLSAVYLKLTRERPELAAAWVGEDDFAPEREGEKLPDAVLKNPEGRVFFVVEFGGKYNAARFRAFHQDCSKRGLPYELW